MIHKNFLRRPGGEDRMWAPILHGAEITVPGRLPAAKSVMKAVLGRAPFVVSAGGYPLAEAERIVGRRLDAILVPPGVDTTRFKPITPAERERVRRLHGVGPEDVLVLGLSRLVPRKGFDVLIEAAHRLAGSRPELVVGIGGTGRDEQRLAKLARSGPGRVSFLGRVPESELVATYASSDAFAMLCRNRWAGYEQEGFGIVFLEAAAAEVPVIAGRSGGSHEAVDHGVTGIVVDNPGDVDAVTAALDEMVTNEEARTTMGTAGRKRTIAEFDYAVLAQRLREGLAQRVGPT
jgi:phosphatidylinositol alpha-1,6-mannosyltransferase